MLGNGSLLIIVGVVILKLVGVVRIMLLGVFILKEVVLVLEVLEEIMGRICR